MAPTPPLLSLLDLRLLVLSGKGGVGRTTVAAALARVAARRGKRVLVAQTDAVERLGKPAQTGAEDHRHLRSERAVLAHCPHGLGHPHVERPLPSRVRSSASCRSSSWRNPVM